MSALLMGSRWKQKQLEQGLMDIDSELFKKDKEKEKEVTNDNEKEKEKEIEERHDKTTDRVMDEESLCPELLFACVLDDDYEKVDILLLRYNFNPNLKSGNGSTPLHLAAWRGYLAIVFCLIQYGADVNIRQDNTGWTALHLALRFGHEDVASALISAGASIDVIDAYGCSSMTFAALGGKLSIMQFLISQRLDVNHLPKGDGKQPLPAGYDCPPLHTVSGSGNLPLVECLIVEGKADINKRDSVLRTPLMYAVRSNHVEVVQFLLKHGARVNLYDTKGKTALHYAAKRGNQELIEELVDAKADIYKKDNEGLTPLDRLTNDEDGSKRAHMVEIVERRKQRLLQNVIYTSMVGVATGMAIYFGKH